MMKKNYGFSLLEALIASTIFASVLVLASSAFKFYMGQGERKLNSQAVMDELITLIRIREAISGTHSYFIKENAISNNQASLFFLGNSSGFTGITLNPLQYGNQLTRYSISSREVEGNNSIQLLYCEYDNNVEFPVRSIDNKCDNPLVMAKSLKKVSYEYYGWVSSDALFNTAGENVTSKVISAKSWDRMWDGSSKDILPQFIKISLEYDDIAAKYRPSQLWFKLFDADILLYRNSKESYE